MLSITIERRLLQVVVSILAITPVLVGLAGVTLGPSFLHVTPPWPVDLDSHFRFLSGVFAVIGLSWWSCISDIEKKTDRFRLLGLATFAGGVARFFSLIAAGSPSTGHLIGLCIELVAVPLLLLWQTRIAWSFART